MKVNKNVMTRNVIICDDIKKWTSTKKHYKIRRGDYEGGVSMAVLAKPANFAIVINEDNQHVLNSERTDEHMKKIAEMKRKAKMIAMNLR